MSAAKKLANEGFELEAGTVERIGKTIDVKLWDGLCTAKRAKSCLVAPAVGDEVLCAIGKSGVFVLAVLAGAEGDATRIAAEGDIVLQARGGSVAVHSTNGVDIVSGGAVTTSAPEVFVSAKRGSFVIDEMTAIGRRALAEIGRVAFVSEEVDTRFKSLVQRAKRVFRFVEEIDQTRAGTLDMRAETLVALRGENTVLSARVLAKVDGEQIHLG